MVTTIKGNATSTFGGNVDVTGNVITDAPAFSARNSSDQALTASVLTKVVLDTEQFDTTNAFDSSTNYRFTPTVAGYYQVNVTLRFDGTNMINNQIFLYKNGAKERLLYVDRYTTSTAQTFSGSVLVYLNGSTDYLEVYGFCQGTGLTLDYSSDDHCCIFSGYLARAA